MAEAFLKKSLAEAGVKGVEVVSAGVGAYDGMPASTHAAAAMSEKGLDLSHHKSQFLTKDLVDKASLILVMTRGHQLAIQQEFGRTKAPVFLWRENMPTNKQVSDPYGCDLQTYRESREHIEEAVGSWVEWIKKNLETT